jgi:glycosyltransferase involved in cell wall biosynthesis
VRQARTASVLFSPSVSFFLESAMRVGFDTHTALDAQSGAGHYTIDLIEALVRQAGERDEVVVFHTGPEPAATLAWLLRHERLVHVNVPVRGRRSAEWWRGFSSAAVERLLPEGGDGPRLDVLHSLWAPFLPSQTRRRILTVRCLVPAIGKLTLGFRRCLLQADTVVVTSEGLRQELARRFAEAQPRRAEELERRLRVQPPGVHPRFFGTPRAATVVGLCDAYPFLGEPYLLAAGGVADPERSLRMLIEACRSARERDASLPPLVLLGRPGDTAAVAPILDAAQDAGRVYWLQNLDSDLLPALYRGAELLVYPGLDFASGLPVLEAAAMGVASVVGASCGAAEILGPGVVVADGSEPPAWTEAILRLHQDEARRRGAAERAAERVLALTAESVAKRHWELYRELAQ